MFAVYKIIDDKCYYWGKWADKNKAMQIANDFYCEYGITCKVVEE